MAIPKILTTLRERAYDGDVVTSKLDTLVEVTQENDTLIVSENLIVKNGAKITFIAPCDSTQIVYLRINDVNYHLFLYEGCSISTPDLICFTKDTYVNVIIDTEDSRAYITNGYVRTKKVDVVLSASDWSEEYPYTINLTVGGVTATSTQILLPSLDIEEEQLSALQYANIIDKGQTEGHILLKALGIKPEVDIPITILLRGDM